MSSVMGERRKTARRRQQTVDRGGFLMDVRPLVEWLEWQVRCGWSRRDLAELLGVDEAKVRHWLYGTSRRSEFAVIEEALVHAGRPDLLHSLWPDLDDQIRAYVQVRP